LTTTKGGVFILFMSPFLFVLPVILFLHLFSYRLYKTHILKLKTWDLNICCGKTDGRGINADIKKHGDLPNFVLIDSIYKLPFETKAFNETLCSHTMEHVDDPELFYKELERVSKNITIVIPPLWDIFAVLNIFEHKWIFLSFTKKHHKLPRYIRLPFSRTFQKYFTQFNNA